MIAAATVLPELTPATRALRVAGRIFRASVVAWVPVGPSAGPPLIHGDVRPDVVRAVAAVVASTGAGVVVREVSAVPALAALGNQFRSLLGVPVRGRPTGDAVMLVLCDRTAGTSPDDLSTLVDLANLVGDAVSGQQESSSQEAPKPSDCLDALITNSPVILFKLNGEGVFTFSAGRALQSLGSYDGRVVGRSAFEVYQNHPEVIEPLRKGLAGEVVTFTARIHGITFHTRCHPLKGADGSVYGLIGVAMDVSEQAQGEAALREAIRHADAARARAELSSQRAEAARAEAEMAARAQDRFLTSMSHEIRTPLTGIIGFADLLAETAEGEAHEYARLIQRSGHRLLDTLNSVLQLARLKAEQMEVHARQVDLGEEVAEAARLLQPLARHRDLELMIDVDQIPLATDPAVVHRIVTNLVGNAIKFTDEGRVTVRARTDAGSGCAVITVADTGRGINPDFLPLLFEPFRREHDGQDKPAGTGLGLTITRKLVDLLGARIDVDTAPGRGTTFTLKIPIPGAEQPHTVFWRAAPGDGAIADMGLPAFD